MNQFSVMGVHQTFLTEVLSVLQASHPALLLPLSHINTATTGCSDTEPELYSYLPPSLPPPLSIPFFTFCWHISSVSSLALFGQWKMFCWLPAVSSLLLDCSPSSCPWEIKNMCLSPLSVPPPKSREHMTDFSYLKVIEVDWPHV